MGNRANRLRVLQVGCKDHLLAHGFRDIDADDAAMGDRAAQKCDVVKVRKSEVAGELAAPEQMPLVFLTLQRSADRSEEHTSELQSLMRISYAVFCLKKKTRRSNTTYDRYNIM